MHTFLYVGSSREKRHEAITAKLGEWGIAAFDVVEVSRENEHIVIDEVRSLTAKLQLSPRSSKATVGIIYDAWALTPQAQQALLKLLEEPPPKSLLLCETQNAEELIPTIISRAQVIRLAPQDEPETPDHTAAKDIIRPDARTVFGLVDAVATDREAARTWTTSAISSLRRLLIDTVAGDKQTRDITRRIRALLHAQGQLAVNCNPKLALDTALLS